jgi:hypothetical protein
MGIVGRIGDDRRLAARLSTVPQVAGDAVRPALAIAHEGMAAGRGGSGAARAHRGAVGADLGPGAAQLGGVEAEGDDRVCAL